MRFAWSRGLRRRPFLGVALLLAAPALAQPLTYDQGAMGLGLQLRRLTVAGRVLLVTAHPDDEHNGVLVALSRGRGLRVGLLTLTRGEGGQNAIGPELFDGLGVLRTGELMALHRYDAVEQYFSRAYEFGFSLDMDETLARWGHDETLGDVVRTVRLFRPDVILSLPLESKGEHTHHLASARLAREAFRAAADPARYPEQIAAGLLPWQARKLYQGGVGGGGLGQTSAASVRIATGHHDPLLGMSAQELGSLARAAHRSQAANQLKAEPNQGEAAYALVDAEPAVTENERDPLDGLDLSLSGLGRFAPPGTPGRDELVQSLALAEQSARTALQTFDAQAPEAALPALREGLTRLRDARERLARASEWPKEATAELGPRLAAQEQLFAEALRRAHALSLVLTPSDDLLVAGQRVTLDASVYNAGREGILVDGVWLGLPEGWRAQLRSAPEPGPLAPGSTLRLVYDVVVGPNARVSEPYFKRSATRDRYDLDVPADDGRPFSPPAVVATLRYRSAGVFAHTSVPALARYEGRVVGGERQKELAVVPALSVRLTPGVAVLPLAPSGVAREFRASVTNNTPGPAVASLRVEAPDGWNVEPRESALAFTAEGQEQVVRLKVQPRGTATGEARLEAVAVMDGTEYRRGEQLVAHDHVQERRLYRPSSARLLRFDVRVRPGVAVAFVPGLGDELPGALRQIGVEATVLDGDRLATEALERFSTIVLGVRAYADAKVRAQHARLMAFAEQGGHLVLQYARSELNLAGTASRSSIGSPPAGQQPQDSPFAPFPASVTTERVTDETAPVRLLAPAHALLSEPNAIGPQDFEGWVQERAIQLLDARDPRYTQLLAAADPFPGNPGEKKGLLVDAQVGKGTWTYVALVLFRELPAGVPGAYRLLANLVSRPRAR